MPVCNPFPTPIIRRPRRSGEPLEGVPFHRVAQNNGRVDDRHPVAVLLQTHRFLLRRKVAGTLGKRGAHIRRQKALLSLGFRPDQHNVPTIKLELLGTLKKDSA